MKGIVWGLTLERAREELWNIIANYEMIGIQTIKKVNNQISVFAEFENGDFWKAVRASDNERGSSTNISYIDRDIPEEIVNCIIKPCTKAYPFQAIQYYWAEGIEEIETKIK